MLSSWRYIKIKEAPLEIIDGDRSSNYPKKNEIFKRGKYPFLNTRIIQNNKFDFADLDFIFEEKYNSISKGRLQRGDIVLATRGNGVGKLAIFNSRLYESGLINAQMLIIRVKENMSNNFLFYTLMSNEIQTQFNNYSSGSAQPQLPIRDLRNIKIPLPPLPEQRAIADILSSLDDKIELNNRMNKTLEQMARAIFNRWFVEFEFPPPVAAGLNPPLQGAGYKSSGGVMIDSELGMIPEGWEVVNLPDIIDVNPTRSIKKGANSPYLEMKNLSETSARVKDWVRREFTSGTKFINGDVLLARITPCLENGKTAFVDFLDDKEVGWGSTEYIIFRSKPPLPLEYTYFLARTDDFRTYAIKNMSGTSGRQRVNTSCFDSLKIIKPDEAIAKNYASIISDFLKKIKFNDEESKALVALRDTLLPKLMSGELRVPPEKVREYENA